MLAVGPLLEFRASDEDELVKAETVGGAVRISPCPGPAPYGSPDWPDRLLAPGTGFIMGRTGRAAVPPVPGEVPILCR